MIAISFYFLLNVYEIIWVNDFIKSTRDIFISDSSRLDLSEAYLNVIIISINSDYKFYILTPRIERGKRASKKIFKKL